ncbi:methylated-DNA--[protein]-cysteine S-methyltransferase [Govanella unica]|uniref:Methylated-DNA--protein-cysteine methyltransferase n=1 Tax=Govanella unica TaxID=2975056 RepID=A0A9X3TV72_9PROT|nr:methylated-DNA--[protein]-cysteine S-methyltransferase [Govania unica]MDA5192385.1 methylated-DNA--[protein]-cysteine S-methyltransferase [Govania unica]
MPQLSFLSPYGDLTVSEEDGVIVALDWGRSPFQETTAVLNEAKAQIDAYFDGDLRTFDLPIEAHGTVFQQKVWAALRAIPYGSAKSYGDLASVLSTHARAIGMACGRNPVPILIPCHRILGIHGSLGGYSAGEGPETKAALLRLEGISFRARDPELF